MKILFEDCIVNTENYGNIYMDGNSLNFDICGQANVIHGVPADALQQIAVGIAEGKSYIEMEGHQ